MPAQPAVSPPGASVPAQQAGSLLGASVPAQPARDSFPAMAAETPAAPRAQRTAPTEAHAKAVDGAGEATEKVGARRGP